MLIDLCLDYIGITHWTIVEEKERIDLHKRGGQQG